MDEKIVVKKKFNTSNFVLGAVLSLISLAYIYPIFMVLINALKKSSKITTDAMFKLPTGIGMFIDRSRQRLFGEKRTFFKCTSYADSDDHRRTCIRSRILHSGKDRMLDSLDAVRRF